MLKIKKMFKITSLKLSKDVYKRMCQYLAALSKKMNSMQIQSFIHKKKLLLVLFSHFSRNQSYSATYFLTGPFLAVVFADCSVADVMQHVQQGKRCVKQGDHIKAEMHYLKALHVALEMKDRPQIALVQDLLANLHLYLNNLDQAEVLFRNVLTNLIASGTSPNDTAVIEISLKLASIYAQQNKQQLALSGYSWCMDTCKSNLTRMEVDNFENNHADVENCTALLGMVLDSYGRYLDAIGDHKAALQYTLEASAISEKIYGKRNVHTLVLYNDIASIQCQLSQYDNAMIYISKVISTCEAFPDLVSASEKSVFYTNLSHICKLQGKHLEAEDAYKKALVEVSKTNDKDLKHQVASFVTNIS